MWWCRGVPLQLKKAKCVSICGKPFSSSLGKYAQWLASSLWRHPLQPDELFLGVSVSPWAQSSQQSTQPPSCTKYQLKVIAFNPLCNECDVGAGSTGMTPVLLFFLSHLCGSLQGSNDLTAELHTATWNFPNSPLPRKCLSWVGNSVCLRKSTTSSYSALFLLFNFPLPWGWLKNGMGYCLSPTDPESAASQPGYLPARAGDSVWQDVRLTDTLCCTPKPSWWAKK